MTKAPVLKIEPSALKPWIHRRGGLADKKARYASLIKVPPAMLSKIRSFVVSCAAAYLHDLIKPENDDEIKLKKWLESKIQSGADESGVAEREFKVELKGWPYLNNPKVKDGIRKKRKSFGTITVDVKLSRSGDDVSGAWRPFVRKMLFRIPREYYDGSVQVVFGEIVGAVEHEIEHFTQTLLSFAISKKETYRQFLRDYMEAGFPSDKLLTPEKDRDVVPDTLSKQRQYYHLNIEFFPSLKEAIHRFKAGYYLKPTRRGGKFHTERTVLSSDDLMDMVVTFIARDAFFQALKAYRKKFGSGKYRKAIKVFTKSVRASA